MLRIDATFLDKEYTYRTNDSGEHLFVGVDVNRQISTKSGFRSMRRMKQAIRDNIMGSLSFRDEDRADGKRIEYKVQPSDLWIK